MPLAPSVIRRAGKGDREAIEGIIGSTANLTAEEKDCALELLGIFLDNPLQKDYDFIAAVDSADRAVGYACYGRTPLTAGVYDLYWILVGPAQRGGGIGGALLRRVEETVRSEGARMLVAETSSLPAYEPARSFYARNGFKEEARITAFYKPGDDMITYVKRF